MHQNRSLAGAADAIERTKNAGTDVADEAEKAVGNVANRARRAFDDSKDAAQQVAGEAYDQVGDMFRSSEDFIRRRPVESLAVAAVFAFFAGYLLRR
jgi:ElaB/YqjD/DUF883 family membrane-anchored ribosome-binding protein